MLVFRAAAALAQCLGVWGRSAPADLPKAHNKASEQLEVSEEKASDSKDGCTQQLATHWLFCAVRASSVDLDWEVFYRAQNCHIASCYCY